MMYIDLHHLYCDVNKVDFWKDWTIFTKKDTILGHLISTTSIFKKVFCFFFENKILILYYLVTKIIDTLLHLQRYLHDLYLFFHLSINLSMPLAYQQYLMSYYCVPSSVIYDKYIAF